MKNIRLNVLAGFRQGLSASHLSKIYSLSIDDVKEWRRLTLCGHTDWVDGNSIKFSLKDKRALLDAFYAQDLSPLKFAAMQNIPYGSFRGWIRKVKRLGSLDAAFPPIPLKRVNKRSNLEKIAWAIFHIKKYSMSASEVAVQLGYNIRSVQRWYRYYRLNSAYCHTIDDIIERSVIMDNIHISEKKIQTQREALIQWIKNNISLNQQDTSKVITQITELKKLGLPVYEACNLFGIHRSTYYRHRQHKTADHDRKIVEAIKSFQIKYRYSYGAKRMAKQLSFQFQIPINHKRTARLMKLHGLNARIRQVRKLFPRQKNDRIVDGRPTNNILKRQFFTEEPRKKFVSDMTFFHTYDGWLVLSTIKDLCTKEIVAWDFDTGATVELAMRTLSKIGCYKGAILHSDQGGTYTSPNYRNLAESLGISLSYSRKGNCFDNACMENFYGHLKSETIYQMPITERYSQSRIQLQDIINRYIYWYNNGRIQEGLGYLSPKNFYQKLTLKTVAE